MIESDKRILDAKIIKVHDDTFEVDCPYCSKTHRHGKEVGHRLTHCDSRDNPQGYNLVF